MEALLRMGGDLLVLELHLRAKTLDVDWAGLGYLAHLRSLKAAPWPPALEAVARLLYRSASKSSIALCSPHANATVRAPATTSSTTLAAPTMLTPSASCSSVIPRGLVHAPQSQTLPLLETNSLKRSQSLGRPAASTPSGPPFVPRRTASMVQSTIASWPAVAAMLAATKGNVARSGSSRPQVQLKMSFAFI